MTWRIIHFRCLSVDPWHRALNCKFYTAQRRVVCTLCIRLCLLLWGKISTTFRRKWIWRYHKFMLWLFLKCSFIYSSALTNFTAGWIHLYVIKGDNLFCWLICQYFKWFRFKSGIERVNINYFFKFFKCSGSSLMEFLVSCLIWYGKFPTTYGLRVIMVIDKQRGATIF